MVSAIGASGACETVVEFFPASVDEAASCKSSVKFS